MQFLRDRIKNALNCEDFKEHPKLVISSAGTSKRLALETLCGPQDSLYSNVEPNPGYDQIIAFKAEIEYCDNCRIIAIGGGSVIDFAKLIALFHPLKPSVIEAAIRRPGEPLQNGRPLTCIPTLFGSGAEQTPFAVCYIGQEKFSVASPAIKPVDVIYIPELATTIPQQLKLANIADCFCQAAESITAKSSNEQSECFAKKAIRILLHSSRDYIHGTSSHAASDIALASELSGKAIAISKTTGPHSLSYYLTSCLGWDHGISVTIPFLFFLYNYEVFNQNIQKVNALLSFLSSSIPSPGGVFTNVCSIFSSWGIHIDRLANEISANVDLSEWIRCANEERLSNGPCPSPTWLCRDSLNHFLEVLQKGNMDAQNSVK